MARGQTCGMGATGRAWTKKFCKVCQLAGSVAPLYKSHNSHDCSMSTLRAVYPDKEYEDKGEEEYKEEEWTWEEQSS